MARHPLGIPKAIQTLGMAASNSSAPSKGLFLPGKGKDWGESFILLLSWTFTGIPIPKISKGQWKDNNETPGWSPWSFME